MQPRRLFCPVRAECWFHVTNSGYSSRALRGPFELSEVLEEAGVAVPFELELDPEPGVEGSELEGEFIGVAPRLDEYDIMIVEIVRRCCLQR